MYAEFITLTENFQELKLKQLDKLYQKLIWKPARRVIVDLDNTDKVPKCWFVTQFLFTSEVFCLFAAKASDDNVMECSLSYCRRHLRMIHFSSVHIGKLRDSMVSVLLGYRPDGPELKSVQGLEIFLFSKIVCTSCGGHPASFVMVTSAGSWKWLFISIEHQSYE
jgi:hypothetical protein